MSDTYDSCSVCDRRIDPWGRDGVRCARCNEPCPTCHGDVARCHQALVRHNWCRSRRCDEDVETAYRRALGTLERFTTAKKLTKEWPEAMPIIGKLIPVEARTLPTVQLEAINDEFGLPPSDEKQAA
jgi:hypothetical protein